MSVPSLLRELNQLIRQVNEESLQGKHVLGNIGKTHERILFEMKTPVSPYFKSKLRGLYNTATEDTKRELELVQAALEKIGEIKVLRSSKRSLGAVFVPDQDLHLRKSTMRRGVLMSMLQQAARELPVFEKTGGKQSSSLVGAIPAGNNYHAKPQDLVAALVETGEDEDQWILAEIATYNGNLNSYVVEDIDEEGKIERERHSVLKSHVIPLPKHKADPSVMPHALFPNGQKVMALYPQTTCFYPGLVAAPPASADEEYSISFEDNSYVEGYSPPLRVPQRYVVMWKEPKRRKGHF